MILRNQTSQSVSVLIKQGSGMDKKKTVHTICKQCRKEIKTDIIVCLPCDKGFHPSCHKQHKTYNSANELILCKGKFETVTQKCGSVEGGSSEKRKESADMSASGDGSPASMRVAELMKQVNVNKNESMLDAKVDNILILVNELKDDMIVKDVIRNIIRESIEVEMNKIRVQMQQWMKQELRVLVSKTGKDLHSEVLNLSIETDRSTKMTYSGVVKYKPEAVLIIKPKETEGENSSEITKKDMKSKIDISKLGIGITKLRKVTRGAVVVDCEDKTQADKLKEKVAKDLEEI